AGRAAILARRHASQRGPRQLDGRQLTAADAGRRVADTEVVQGAHARTRATRCGYSMILGTRNNRPERAGALASRPSSAAGLQTSSARSSAPKSSTCAVGATSRASSVCRRAAGPPLWFRSAGVVVGPLCLVGSGTEGPRRAARAHLGGGDRPRGFLWRGGLVPNRPRGRAGFPRGWVAGPGGEAGGGGPPHRGGGGRQRGGGG